MVIDRIYINVHKFDLNRMKVCVGSIRYWYPDIPIFLILDYGSGDMNLINLLKKFNVQILDLPVKHFGWGYGKLEPLFLIDKHRFLMLDSDTVLLGRVLEGIVNIDADFIVDDEEQDLSTFNKLYFNSSVLQGDYNHCKKFFFKGFNSGQWFGTSGILTRVDFSDTITWDEPRVPKSPEIVYKGDQSSLNYLFYKLELNEKINIARRKIMFFPIGRKAEELKLVDIVTRSSTHQMILHWAGMKSVIPRMDIYNFYKDCYFSKLSGQILIAEKLSWIYIEIWKKIKNSIWKANYKLKTILMRRA